MGRLLLARLLPCVLVCTLGLPPIAAQVRLADESDRAAFRAWFVLLADAQFYRTTADVTDCAALVRHAAREALRAHTPEWIRQAALPRVQLFPDVRTKTPLTDDGGLALFRVSEAGRSSPARYAEFADARTIIRFNARKIGRDPAALRPGDLLYFHQSSQDEPDHLMVYVGGSAFEPDGRDWIVYHTGPNVGPPAPATGEVRKVRLADLLRHPAPRWRPVPDNPQFVGVFRLELL
jgi:uncharacterized protein YfaT (DUF1175 family)